MSKLTPHIMDGPRRSHYLLQWPHLRHGEVRLGLELTTAILWDCKITRRMRTNEYTTIELTNAFYYDPRNWHRRSWLLWPMVHKPGTLGTNILWAFLLGLWGVMEYPRTMGMTLHRLWPVQQTAEIAQYLVIACAEVLDRPSPCRCRHRSNQSTAFFPSCRKGNGV